MQEGWNCKMKREKSAGILRQEVAYPFGIQDTNNVATIVCSPWWLQKFLDGDPTITAAWSNSIMCIVWIITMPNDTVWGCHVQNLEVDKSLSVLGLMIFSYRRYKNGRSEVEGPL